MNVNAALLFLRMSELCTRCCYLNAFVFQDERAVCAMAWALRNLIIQDATNRQLVGKYGVANLAALLPDENAAASPAAAAAAAAGNTQGR